MTRTPNSAVVVGRSLAVSSRPQNVVFSGGLAVLIATLNGNFWDGVQCYALLWVLYAAAATYNNLHDMEADRLNRRDNPFSDSRLTTRMGYAWTALNVVVALLLQFVLTQPGSLLATLAYICLLVAYSNHAIRLQARGFVAPIVLGICYAGIPVVLASGQSGLVDWSLAGLLTLLCVPLLLAKDYKDLEGDRAAGKRTALVRYGARTVKIVSLVVAVCGCLAVITYVMIGTPHQSTALLLLSGLCLATYLYSVWYVHERQVRRPRYFLRLPQLALIVLAGCLATV